MNLTLIYEHSNICEPICLLTVLSELVLSDIFGLLKCNTEDIAANIPPLQNRKTKDPLKTRYASRDK